MTIKRIALVSCSSRMLWMTESPLFIIRPHCYSFMTLMAVVFSSKFSLLTILAIRFLVKSISPRQTEKHYRKVLEKEIWSWTNWRWFLIPNRKVLFKKFPTAIGPFPKPDPCPPKFTSRPSGWFTRRFLDCLTPHSSRFTHEHAPWILLIFMLYTST